jgi:uncharacterized protein (TIGR00369 family)
MAAVDINTFPVIAVREFLGGKVLAADDDTGRSRIRYQVGERHLNPVGTAFGGFLAAMIDDAASLGTWFAGRGRPFATAGMTVNYLNPARPGEALLAEIEVLQSGARQAFVEVRLAKEADGVLVATGTVVQSYLRPADTKTATF